MARSIFAIKSQISRLALPSGPARRGRQSQHCCSHCRGNISGQILRITLPRPRHGLNYCWVSRTRYVDNISHGTDHGVRPSMGWWANVIQGTKSVFAQDLPWHISLCQPCPAPWPFLWYANCAEDFIWCTTSKENSLKLFLCKIGSPIWPCTSIYL